MSSVTAVQREVQELRSDLSTLVRTLQSYPASAISALLIFLFLFNVCNFQSCHAISFFNRVINFFSHVFILVLTHVLFATFFNFFMFHLQVDVVGPLLLNASLLLVLTTDYSD